MKIHTFGTFTNPKMLLIHGALTPWQIWNEQIEFFSKNYYIIVPALDAHTEEAPSEFISIEEEAKKIESYLIENAIDKIDVLCAFSMGGAIANILWGNQKIKIETLVLDSAVLAPTPNFIQKMMISSYNSIIHNSRSRNPKTLKSFKESFLPEKHLESYLKIADNMSDSSIKNMIKSVSSSSLSTTAPQKTKILFMYGTKLNEYIAKKSVKLIKKYYPDTTVFCWKGYAHCYKISFEPLQWTEVVNKFLNN